MKIKSIAELESKIKADLVSGKGELGEYSKKKADEHMSNDYYNQYNPILYDPRTNALRNSIKLEDLDELKFKVHSDASSISYANGFSGERVLENAIGGFHGDPNNEGRFYASGVSFKDNFEQEVTKDHLAGKLESYMNAKGYRTK